MFDTVEVLLLLLFIVVFYLYNQLRITRQRFSVLNAILFVRRKGNLL